jgi:hypothetical protein
VSARTEAELARKEDLVGRSLPGLSVSGTDAGIDLSRPRVGLMSVGDSRPRPRGDQPSRLPEPDSRRRPWRRWPGRGDDVVLQSGDLRTVSPSEASSDVTPQNCVGRIRYNSSKSLNLKYLLIRLFLCESIS